jgi:hypothetical protein
MGAPVGWLHDFVQGVLKAPRCTCNSALSRSSTWRAVVLLLGRHDPYVLGEPVQLLGHAAADLVTGHVSGPETRARRAVGVGMNASADLSRAVSKCTSNSGHPGLLHGGRVTGSGKQLATRGRLCRLRF